MSSESSSIRVPLFNGKNFGLWKKQVTVALKVKDLGGLLDEVTEEKRNDAWKKKDNEAQAVLYGSMDQSVALKVVSCETAADMWTRLKEVYESTNVALVGKVFEEFYSYRKSPSDDMAGHVSKVEALASHLETVGQKQTDEAIMSRLLHSLPASYNSLKEAWDSVDPGKQTKNTLISRLLSHGAVNEETVKDVALVTENKEQLQVAQAKGRKNIRCYNCQKMGHYARDCRSKPRPRDDAIALVMSDHARKSDHWIVDSGASQHTCCRREWFSSIAPCGEKLQVGNQEWVKSAGKGTVRLICKLGAKQKVIDLTDVLFIPSMTYNLFSTGSAAVRGATTTLDSDGCTIQLGGQVIARGRTGQNGLCRLDAEVVGGSVMIASQKRSPQEWHRCLGHVDQQVIEEMANNGCVQGMDIAKPAATDRCEICPEGKATRAHHTMASSFEPLEVGDKIDMDLIGPVADESLGKKRYILLAKDSFSNYSHIYLLNNKAEAAEKLQQYIGVFEAESNRRIRMINADNGSEFCNHQVQLLCDLEHIKLCFSAPYTPEQNGSAERNNRTIIETTRTLMADSRLPKSLWAEAANTAVYLRNRVAKRGENITPYELFWGRKPYIGHIVPFGTEVHTLINERRIGKFDSKTEEGYIVGFTERASNYRVLLKDSMRMKITCDVILAPHGTRQTPLQETIATVTHHANSRREPMSSSALDDYFRDLHQRICREAHDQSVSRASKSQSHDEYKSCYPDISSEIESPTFSQLTAHSTPLNPDSHPPPVLERSTSLRDSQSKSRESSQVTFQAREQASTQGGPNSPQTSDLMMRQGPNQSSPFQGRQLPRTPPHNRSIPGSEVPPSAEETSGLQHMTRSVRRRLNQILVATADEMLDEPKTYREAVTGANRHGWETAIQSELDAHSHNGTWITVPRPEQGTLLTAKWVFKIKRNEQGNIDKLKARLVARGFLQQEGKDYTETFAPVARSESIRALLAIAVVKNLWIERFDVSTAFLNGELEEDVFVEAPEGVEIGAHQCLKLKKALYGLKQAPKSWNSAFDRAMREFGFDNTKSDACVYHQPAKQRLLGVYVDDGLVLGPDQSSCLDVIRCLNQKFTTKRIESEIFLGMQLRQGSTGLHLSQQRYISDLVKRFNMQDCHGADSPMVDAKGLYEEEGAVRTDVPYREAIGGLLYVALCTRPDVLFPTILLSRFNEKHYTKHWSAIKRVLGYLKQTSQVGLSFKQKDKRITVEVYSDADWAGDVSTRKSTSGVLIQLSGCPIIFVSRQQTTVAQSSTEAELVAACEALKELMWLTNFLKELELVYDRPILYIDNKSTIEMIKNNDTKRRSKHIDIKFHLIREKFHEGLFALEYVDTKSQLADFMTKAIGSNQLHHLLEASGITSAEEAGIERGCEENAIPSSCSLRKIGPHRTTSKESRRVTHVPNTACI